MAFEEQRWGDADAAFAEIEADAALTADDLESAAVAAYLTGRDDRSVELWSRAHAARLDAGDEPGAARMAFWLGMLLVNRGEMAHASGWFGRAARLVEDGPDCAERGYLLIPAAVQQLESGQAEAARASFQRAAEVADRFDDRDLAAVAGLGLGQARVRVGDVDAGLALLDEAMVAVEAGEISPILTGVIYCGVIDTCQRVHDVRRAQEWTAALTRWCEAHPELVPFRGQCLVHRSELLQLRGWWDEAMAVADQACERLADPPGQPAIGAAHYRQAELYRLQGRYDAAEAAYRDASAHGHTPHPGLALLRLAQGEVDAAAAAIRRALDELSEDIDRVPLLTAHAEIALAAGDVATARDVADRLERIAARAEVSMFTAMAAHIDGAVSLVEGEPREALPRLRHAWRAWQELDAPYEAARVRVLVGMACRHLGDDDGAAMEFDAAREVFTRVGAGPDLRRLGELASVGGEATPGGLTPRELEVLRLLAEGRSNREIATELVISEHTVARHVQNMFAKLDVSSRTAAAAFAFEHDLL